MTTETTKLKAKLDNLNSSLSTLEETLAPLFVQTLPETTLGLSALERAKLQTVLPYIVYDLTFIYLKAKGIDPKSHPVVEELARVKKYFDKISSAENPEQPRTALDKAAATRFIKHAIAQSTYGEAAAEEPPEPSTFVEPKVTSKMVERAEYEAELRERGDASSSEADDLEIIDAPPKTKGKGKAKEMVGPGATPVSAGSKRRRPAVDPFAGFGDDESASTPKEDADESETKKRKKDKKAKKGDSNDGSKTPKKRKKADK